MGNQRDSSQSAANRHQLAMPWRTDDTGLLRQVRLPDVADLDLSPFGIIEDGAIAGRLRRLIAGRRLHRATGWGRSTTTVPPAFIHLNNTNTFHFQYCYYFFFFFFLFL